MITPINYFNSIIDGFKNNNSDKIIKNLETYISMIINGQLESPIFFYHPLGFIYSKIYNDRLRLHIWDSTLSKRKTSLDIHTHYYRISSLIYRGKIINEIFDIDKERDIKNEYFIYNGEYKNQDRKLVKSQNTIYLKLASKELIEKNKIYNIELETFHRAYPFNDLPTVTIVHTQNHGEPTPIVVGDIHATDELYFQTIKVEKEKVIKSLENMLLKHH
ncbi:MULTISPECIES: hypothetical protein [Chryseobacterium]|uniref:hypothetical protein n=1 Tax=Chryseobacterium TaxID=59732 RepID=UPI0016231C53|nr:MULTISPECIES: hypothetical protein [Chryseobacterium]